MTIVLILMIFIAIIIFLWQVSNMVSVFFGSPYVTVRKKVIIKALKAANLQKGDIFYDLGSGKGDVLIIAEKFGAKVFGYEISPFYYLWAKARVLNRPNIQIKYQNINNVSLKRADVVYCYLLPKFLEKLSLKFQKELKSGARLISVGFPIKISLFPAGAKIRDKYDKYIVENHKIYIYRF